MQVILCGLIEFNGRFKCFVTIEEEQEQQEQQEDTYFNS